jgi:hypothetical protein
MRRTGTPIAVILSRLFGSPTPHGHRGNRAEAGAVLTEALQHFFSPCCMNSASVGGFGLDPAPGSAPDGSPRARPPPSHSTLEHLCECCRLASRRCVKATPRGASPQAAGCVGGRPHQTDSHVCARDDIRVRPGLARATRRMSRGSCRPANARGSPSNRERRPRLTEHVMLITRRHQLGGHHRGTCARPGSPPTVRLPCSSRSGIARRSGDTDDVDSAAGKRPGPCRDRGGTHDTVASGQASAPASRRAPAETWWTSWWAARSVRRG